MILNYCLFLQHPLRAVAQGQVQDDLCQGRAEDHRVHHGRLHLLRDEGRLRGHQRQEELGGHPRSVNVPRCTTIVQFVSLMAPYLGLVNSQPRLSVNCNLPEKN